MPFEPRDALERMGLTEEYLYSSSDKSMSREEFGKRLDAVLSDERVAAALDVTYAVMHRADSMADDGNADFQKILKGCFAMRSMRRTSTAIVSMMPYLDCF